MVNFPQTQSSFSLSTMNRILHHLITYTRNLVTILESYSSLFLSFTHHIEYIAKALSTLLPNKAPESSIFLHVYCPRCHHYSHHFLPGFPNQPLCIPLSLLPTRLHSSFRVIFLNCKTDLFTPYLKSFNDSSWLLGQRPHLYLDLRGPSEAGCCVSLQSHLASLPH